MQSCMCARMTLLLSKYLKRNGILLNCRSFHMTKNSAQTYYNILGIPKSASQAEIKEAYIRLCKEHHPDRNLTDAQKSSNRFVKINEAYSVLSNVQSKRDYDATLSNYSYAKEHGRYTSAYRNHPYSTQKTANPNWDGFYSHRPRPEHRRRDRLDMYWHEFYRQQKSRGGPRADHQYNHNPTPSVRSVQLFLVLVGVVLVTRVIVAANVKRYRTIAEKIEEDRHLQVRRRAEEALKKKQKYEEGAQANNDITLDTSKFEDA